jgi:arylsulfatase A-like enzyme
MTEGDLMMRDEIEVANVPASGDPACLAPPNLLAAGVWWGVIAGVLELSVRQASWAIRPRVTVGTIRTNRHALWMLPVSEVLVLGAVGLMLLALAQVVPKVAAKIATPLLAALAMFAALRLVDHLHWSAQLALACGLATALMRVAVARPVAYRRLVYASLAPALIAIAGWSAYHGNRVGKAEARAVAALPAVVEKTPNVLLLVMDNVRADDLSLYGYARDTTPNLKRLAAKGIRFDQARSTAPWTLPSHASMLTGRWPSELSVTVDTPLDAAEPTLAEALAARGYATGGFVANTYYCNASYGLDRGFSHYEDFAANREVSLVETLRAGSLGRFVIDKFRLGVREFPGDEATRKSATRINRNFLAWLDRRGDRPFFAFLNYYDAHEPFRPPAYSPRKFGLSARSEAERATILHSYEALVRRKAGAKVSNPSGDAEVIRRAAELLRDSYDDCIASLDTQIGLLIDDLGRRGVLDNTLVIITSDHGEEFNDKSMFGHGLSVYRPEVHVPLVILPPAGHAGGRVIDAPASLRDLPATVLDLLAVPGRSPFPGLSLARHWTTPDADVGPVVSEVEHQTMFVPSRSIPASLGAISSIVKDRHVYIRRSDGHEEVYDLDSDPGETQNLADLPGRTSLVAGLRQALDRARGGAAEPEPSRIAGRERAVKR